MSLQELGKGQRQEWERRVSLDLVCTHRRWTFGHLDNSEHGGQMLDQPLCPIICPWLNATSTSRICTLPQINFSTLARYGRIVGPTCMVVPWLGNTYISQRCLCVPILQVFFNIVQNAFDHPPALCFEPLVNIIQTSVGGSKSYIS